MLFELDQNELKFVEKAAQKLDVSRAKIITQAIRQYQLVYENIYILEPNPKHPINKRMKKMAQSEV